MIYWRPYTANNYKTSFFLMLNATFYIVVCILGNLRNRGYVIFLILIKYHLHHTGSGGFSHVEINYHKIAAMATFNKQYKISQETACIKCCLKNSRPL
jgi:hypothetical protein